MTKETVGYVQLEWTCPFCGTRNPGPNKKCSNCGSPQPDGVQFEQAAQELLIEDELLIEQAKAGPDIHCPYCGTRNPAGTDVCRNCMGDLTDAEARAKGKVVGKHKKEAAPDITCPYCGTMNPATATKCAQCNGNLQEGKPQPQPRPAQQRRGVGIAGIIGIVVLIGLCLFVASLFFRTDDVGSRVTSVEWTRRIAIEALVPVQRSAFIDEIPANAPIESCRLELHHVQGDPAPDAEKICGTPYTVDTGTGIGEVVQDCQYEVYEDFCTYTVDEWQQVDVVSQSGADLVPIWPEPELGLAQRLGTEEELYEVIFESDGERFTYTTSSFDQFARFEIGSEWILQVNQLGGVISVEPAR